MGRTDTAERFVAAAPDRVYAAFADPDRLVHWLPPGAATATIPAFDLRPGGRFRVILDFADDPGATGKTTESTDALDARFVEVDPGRAIAFAVEFESDDPTFAGTMTMRWTVRAADGGSLVEFRADDVPAGITEADHRAGLHASLDQLAAHVSGSSDTAADAGERPTSIG